MRSSMRARKMKVGVVGILGSSPCLRVLRRITWDRVLGVSTVVAWIDSDVFIYRRKPILHGTRKLNVLALAVMWM